MLTHGICGTCPFPVPTKEKRRPGKAVDHQQRQVDCPGPGPAPWSLPHQPCCQPHAEVDEAPDHAKQLLVWLEAPPPPLDCAALRRLGPAQAQGRWLGPAAMLSNVRKCWSRPQAAS